MLDDLLLFFAAMLALEITSIGTRYARWSNLLWWNNHAVTRLDDDLQAGVVDVKGGRDVNRLNAL